MQKWQADNNETNEKLGKNGKLMLNFFKLKPQTPCPQPLNPKHPLPILNPLTPEPEIQIQNPHHKPYF